MDEDEPTEHRRHPVHGERQPEEWKAGISHPAASRWKDDVMNETVGDL